METALNNPPIDNFVTVLDSGEGVVLQMRLGSFIQVPFTYDYFDEFVSLVNKRQREIIPLAMRQAQCILGRQHE